MSTTDPREREETDHEAEAQHYLDHSDVRASEEWPVQTGEHKADVIARAQVHATLALVAVQREANEQARVSTLIHLATITPVDSEAMPTQGEQNAWRQIFIETKPYALRPEIAKVLGIGGDDESVELPG